MSTKNTINGKAFEFACLKAIQNRVQAADREASQVASPALNTAEADFQSMEEGDRDRYMSAAYAAVNMIIPVEPKILYGKGRILLAIASDSIAIGPEGDVRDVIMMRNDEGWQVGISCKHNHEALKHPRITESKDFGGDWVGYRNSPEYMTTMGHLIEPLKDYQSRRMKWPDVPDKQGSVYLPICQAYIDEIWRLCQAHSDVPERLLSYFFGSQDFYKVIMKEGKQITQIEGFNMHGTLNQHCGQKKPIFRVPVLDMPTRLIDASFKPQSQTTIILTFDGGWSISMRLHNKDSLVRPTSLAWDVNLVGMPPAAYRNMQSWL